MSSPMPGLAKCAVLCCAAIIACAGWLAGGAAAAAPPALGPRAGSEAAGGELWAPPLGEPLVVAGPYRAPPHPYGSGHRGIDLPATPGAVIVAPASGAVSFAGVVVDRGVLSIRVDARTVLSLEPVDSELAEGEPVSRGQPIGVAASGGHCAAECVHLGVRVDDEYVDPVRFFAGRPVLLPWG